MNRSDEYVEIREIAESVISEEVTPDQVQRLEVLLEESSEARRFYFEYIGMHVHMKGTADTNMEVVMRRSLQVDEVIVRPTTSGSLIQADPTLALSGPVAKQKNIVIWLPLAACVVLAIALFYTFNRKQQSFAAEIISGRLSTQAGVNESSGLEIGNYTAEKKTQIKLPSGDIVEIQKGSSFQLNKNSSVKLMSGSLSIVQNTGINLKMYGPNFRLDSEGSKVKINLTKENSEIVSGKGILLFPNRWRPKHYWSFDSKSDRALDLAGDAHGVPKRGAKKTKGLIGSGAYRFDNSKHALIDIGSGGGTAAATGSFAVSDGVTIEALIVPKWTGKPGELDEIFRKDQSDQDLRMLLSFQNDKGKKWVFPKGDVDESLGFGLYLVGQGYHELKLALDGKNGRPTLAALKDGKAHHVVATYSVKTGLKAMYIDGIMYAHYYYPAGSKMLSGGSGIATIGNSPNNPNSAKEAFNGVIDEVAFYDFSLPHYMIVEHFKSFQNGTNYFGLEPSSEKLPKDTPITLPDNETIILDPVSGLPTSLISK